MSYENIKIEKVYIPQENHLHRLLKHLTHQKIIRVHHLKGLTHLNASLRDLILRFQARTAILYQSFSKLLIQQHFSLNLFPVQSSLV